MKTFFLTLSVCLIATLTACKTTDNPTPPPAQESQKAPSPSSDVITPAAPTELSAEGELQSVDMTAKTLVIKDATGADRKFVFTDNTGILGVSGAQGLSGKKGSHVKVGYTTEADINSAIWIEVSPASKDAQRK